MIVFHYTNSGHTFKTLFTEDTLQVNVHILAFVFFSFYWMILTDLTFEMHFVRFHPDIASCLFSRGKNAYNY